MTALNKMLRKCHHHVTRMKQRKLLKEKVVWYKERAGGPTNHNC